MKTTLIAALSLDGKIARCVDELVDWTSREDKKNFKQVTIQSGVVIMGMRTFQTIQKKLPERLNIVLTHSPEMHLQEEGLEFTNVSLDSLLISLEKRGYEDISIIGGRDIFTQFLETGLVTNLNITIEPILIGKGIDFIDFDSEAYKLKLINYKLINSDTINLIYKLEYT